MNLIKLLEDAVEERERIACVLRTPPNDFELGITEGYRRATNVIRIVCALGEMPPPKPKPIAEMTTEDLIAEILKIADECTFGDVGLSDNDTLRAGAVLRQAAKLLKENLETQP